MKIKEINTLDGVEIKNRRNCGNTNRQINQAIEYLFQGYRVKVLDHYCMGGRPEANRYLAGRIMDRLKNEYPNVQYKFCSITNYIELLDSQELIKYSEIDKVIDEYGKKVLIDGGSSTLKYDTINKLIEIINN